MVRILVVGDETLQHALAGRFGSGIEVAAARSAEQAVVQALIERPELILCSPAGLGRSLEEFRGELQKAGLEATPLLCVEPGAEDEVGVDDAPPGFARCSEENVFEAVATLLPAPPDRPERRPVRLLASMQRIPFDSGESSQNLANVLELDAQSLLIESPMRLESGQRLALSFFLPGSGCEDCAAPERVSVACRVTDPRDDLALQYEATVDFLEESSARAIAEFLSKPSEASEER